MSTRGSGCFWGLVILCQGVWGADPLRNWETNDSKAQSGLITIAYGAGLYVAVGNEGTIVTSPDAITWTARQSGTAASLNSIVYGEGRFVAVGGDYLHPKATVVTSKDGLTWNLVELDLSNVLRGVTYGQGLFVAVGGSGPGDSIILSSEDAFQWETRLKYEPMPFPWLDAPVYTAVAYGNDLFAAVAPDAVGNFLLATSPDGITWTRQRSGIGYNYPPCLAFGNGLFVGGGGYDMSKPMQHYGVIRISKDSLDWEKTAEIVGGQGDNVTAIACGSGQIVVVGRGRYACRSTDGRTWFTLPNPGMSGICFGNDRFVGVGGSLTFRSGTIGKLEAGVSLAGQVEGTITGVTGQSYEIRASTDLTSWSVLTNVTIVDGAAHFSDTLRTNTSQRFYDARLLPFKIADVVPEMVWIKPGTFTMGSPATEKGRMANEGPQTRVRISRGFWMGKYEVTEWEYLALMGMYSSDTRGNLQYPIVSVTWYTASQYCAKLTEQECAAGRLPDGYVYRLPTEAEWEYACRAGTTTRFSYGNDPDYSQLSSYANYRFSVLYWAGQKKPNPWGLYDMHGNAWEWCLDLYGLYPGGSVTDPKGATSGMNCVIRGGGWFDEGWRCRSAIRADYWPDSVDSQIGFRVVLAPNP